jgi:hypothetical protein
LQFSSLFIYDDDHSTDTNRYDTITMATEGKKSLEALTMKMCEDGIEVPYSYKRALAIDKETGTTSWHLSIKKELDDIDSYSTFENMGRISVVPLMSFKGDVGVQHPTGAIQQMTH